MNKNRYRVIFSKSKNMFIAVAENIKSQTKAAGQSTNSNQINASSEIHDSKSFHQLWQVKSIVASISLFMMFSPVYAQIQADPAASAHQRAVIGVGKNQQGQNVPVINIQTPKNGVSHNVYNRFDVLQPGVVLNNSRNGAGSVIVGKVEANPYLQTGEARVILNEVNSAAASRFEGNLEVAGQRADVIIANPSGINIQGGGFINANQAIFTTGKPQLNEDGSIKQFVIGQGKINVNATENSLGLGGNNNNADYVDIYAKAVELNAQVHANQDLQVITGSNNISDNLSEIKSNNPESTSPTFALDVKALGGMYANNIFIVGTEKGLGVSNAGTIQSLQNLVITSSGKIENKGTIKNTNPQNSLLSINTLEAADIVNKGSIIANNNILLNSSNNFLMNGGYIEKSNKNSEGDIYINSEKNTELTKKSKIENISGNTYINSGDVFINGESIIKSNKNLELISNKDIKIQNNSTIHGSNGLYLSSQNKSEILDSNLSTINNNIDIFSFDNENEKWIPLKFNIKSEAGSTLRIRDSEDNIFYTGIIDKSGASPVEFNSESPYFIINTIDQAGNISKDFRVENNRLQTDTILKGVRVSANNANLNVYSKGVLKIEDLDLNSNSTSLKNLNVEALKKIIWDSTVDSTISGGVSLRSDSGININSGGFDVGDNFDIHGKNLKLNSKIQSKNDINIVSLKGDIKSENLDIDSTQGKVSIIAQGHVDFGESSFSDSNVTPIKINANKDIIIASTESKIDLSSTELKSKEGNIKIQSNGNTNLNKINIKSKGNIELFSPENLKFQEVIIDSQQHVALKSKKILHLKAL